MTPFEDLGTFRHEEMTNGSKVNVTVTHDGQEYELPTLTLADAGSLDYSLEFALEEALDVFWDEFWKRKEME